VCVYLCVRRASVEEESGALWGGGTTNPSGCKHQGQQHCADHSPCDASCPQLLKLSMLVEVPSPMPAARQK
jgi:hypothetical protein